MILKTLLKKIPLDDILNKAISDSAGLRELQALEECSIIFYIRDINFRLNFEVKDNAIKIGKTEILEGDIEISVSIDGLLRLLQDKSDMSVFRDEAVVIKGRTDLVAKLKELMDVVEIDKEEVLATLIGDFAAHKATHEGRKINLWLEEVMNSGQSFVAESLVEELRLLASRPRAEKFISQVQEVRDEAARLNQRFETILRNNK